MTTREWNLALDGYAQALRAADKSPGTIRLYRYKIMQLVVPVCRDPWAVTARQLVGALAVPSWSAETRKSSRAALRSFYGWAKHAGYIDEDPAFGLLPISVPAGVARPAPESVIDEGLGTATPRVRLMLSLAAYAGLRASEVARVNTSDRQDGVLYVLGKGRRERWVPLELDLDADLAFWDYDGDGWAFPNGLGSHISPGHATRLMSNALPGDWTAHNLRHRLATQAYAGTRDLLAVQALLGHSSVETTRRYVQMPQDALRAAINAAGRRRAA